MLAINNLNVAQCSVSRPAIAAPVPTACHTRARKQPTIAALGNVAAPVLPGEWLVVLVLGFFGHSHVLGSSLVYALLCSPVSSNQGLR
jgi:hypothetical protein